MINITINENGSTTPNIVSLGSQFENLDDTIQFTFPSDLEGLNKYVVAKTYDDSKKENITRVTPLVDNKFIIGQAITKITGQWLLYTLCKAYSPDGNVERVSISDPIIATVNENDFDISDIETAEVDPNIKIIYDELKELKKTLEANEATRQENEKTRQNAENERVSNETARANAEQARQTNEAQRAENEVNRASAETARVNAETARNNAETNRATAETARTTAEANRVIAEQSRVNAEQLRVTADERREDNTNNAIKTMTDSTNKAIDTLNEKIGIIDGLRTDIDANTKEIGKTSRSLTALWDLNKGISYKFEDDIQQVYQKTVPTGARLGAVNAIGGRTITYNQMFDYNKTATQEVEGVTFTNNNDGSYTASGTSTGVAFISKSYEFKKGHVYLNRSLTTAGSSTTYKSYITGTDMFDSATYQTDYGKGAINKALKDGYAYFVPLYVIEGNTVQGLKIVPQLFDLTKMFGSGNEPSTVAEFEAMFTEDYYPYNEGTLMSMGTKEVVNVGKNMFKCEHFSATGLGGTYKPSLNNSYGTSIDSIEPSNKVTVTQSKIADETNAASYTNGYFCVSFSPIVLNDNYIVFFDITPTKKLIENAKVIIFLNGVDNINASYAQDLQVGKTTRLYFNIVKSNNQLKYIEVRNSGISGIFENFQIEKGNTATAYTQYTEHTFTIPQAILNIEGYGWGVGTAHNYVNYTNNTFGKCVGRVDLGSLDWNLGSDSLYRAPLNSMLFKGDLMCSKYEGVKVTSSDSIKQGQIASTNSQQLNFIRVRDNSFTDAEAFRQSLQGVYLYYELATPIFTDISDIIGDTFKEPFEVEPNGSLTFKNVNGDGYRLAVPSNVKYTVKLSEV